MLVNQIIPTEMRERICVHCDRHDNDTGDPMTYLIAGPQQGKSTETIRQAVFRRNTILSTEYDFYRSAGMKHVSEARPGEVSYLGLRDIFADELKLTEPLNLCVDNARTVLEELLTERFNVPVKINFMSLEA